MAGERLIRVTLPNRETGGFLQNNNFKTTRRLFAEVAKQPHGGDPKLGAFYQAVHDLSGENKYFASFFSEAVDTAVNRGIAPGLFVNLFYRANQFVDMHGRLRQEYDESYTRPEAWKKLLVGEDGLVTDSGETTTHGAVLQDILKTKETTTTIYQRYAGPKAVLNAFFNKEGSEGLLVADFGCGANYGLRGLRGDLAFEDDITIHEGTTATQASRLNGLLATPINLTDGLGVDKNSVDGVEEFMWRMACSFYPNELTPGSKQNLIQLEKKMATVPGVKFLQGDLLELEHNHSDGTLPTDRLNAVIISTVLYQLANDQKAQQKIIDSAIESLGNGGIIILQDFVEKDSQDPSVLHFKGPQQWGEPFSYRTLILRKGSNNWEEVLQWESGRCKEVKPGADFDRIFPPSPAHDPIKREHVYPAKAA